MRIVVLFLLLSFQTAVAMSRGPSQRDEPLIEGVGVQTLEYYDEARDRPVVVEFWYPTDLSRGVEPIRDAPVAKRSTSMPLIVMSHGHRGTRKCQEWLALQLARKGYVLAAVEHFGNARESFHPLLSLRFWDRTKDISYALDQILEEFGPQIDGRHIGFIGYSLGGMTGLGLAGGQAKNVREIVLREHQNHKGFTEEIIAQVDFSEGEKLYTDARIQALLLVCPANFIYPPESLQQIKIPVGLIAALHDETLPHALHASPLIRHLAPHKLKMIREKVPHSFLGLKPEKEDTLHREVAIFAAEFFKYYFKK